MINIRISNQDPVDVPNQWDELTPEQCEWLLKQRIAADDGLVVKFLFLFFPTIPWTEIAETALERIVMELQVFRGEPSFTKAIFKRFEHNGWSFELPGDLLENFTLERYADAENAVQKMIDGGDESAAFAYLLWPVGRRNFDTRNNELGLSVVNKFEGWKKLYLLCLFLGCSKGLRTHFPETFKGQQGKGSNALARFGWLNVFFSLAKLPQYQSIDKVRKEPLHQALAVLEWEAIQAKEREQQLKRA